MCARVITLQIVVFFFKQKTAYERRISDWSSDVCSPDLIAVDQLDDRHRRHVAVAEAGLQHPAVAAVALLVAAGQFVEQLGRDLRVAQHRERLAAGVQVAALAEGDETVDDAPQVFRLRQGGLDLLVLHQGSRQIGEHRSEEHTSELQSIMRISYAVFCLKNKIKT